VSQNSWFWIFRLSAKAATDVNCCDTPHQSGDFFFLWVFTEHQIGAQQRVWLYRIAAHLPTTTDREGFWRHENSIC
jgi:hypothetical protein